MYLRLRLNVYSIYHIVVVIQFRGTLHKTIKFHIRSIGIKNCIKFRVITRNERQMGPNVMRAKILRSSVLKIATIHDYGVRREIGRFELEHTSQLHLYVTVVEHVMTGCLANV